MWCQVGVQVRCSCGPSRAQKAHERLKGQAAGGSLGAIELPLRISSMGCVIMYGAALQVGVELPSTEVAGRVALSVAQNVAQKAHECLEDAQESAQHSVKAAVGLAAAPGEHSDEEPEDEHSKALITSLNLLMAQMKPLKNWQGFQQLFVIRCIRLVPYSASRQ